MNAVDEQLSCLISLTSLSRECEDQLDRAAYLQRSLSLHFRHQPHFELPERLQLELIYDQILTQAENSSATSRLPRLHESHSFQIRSEAGFIEASMQLRKGNSHRLIGAFLDAKFHELRQSGLFALMFRLLEQYVTRQLHSRQWFAATQTLQLGQRLAFECHFSEKVKQLKNWERRLIQS